MAEKLEKINLFGQEFELTSRGGAGGSGGGGMGITGGAYVPAEGGITTTNRWLRFDFDNPSHKALKILAGTTFSMGDTIIPFDEDTSVNLSDYISEPGADYYVFVNADKRVVCSTLRTQPDGYMFIGQFHTLCVDCNEHMTGIISTGKESKSVGEFITIQNYFKERDLDFYNFYTKEIRAMNNDSYYNVATVDHPLSGFKACDILPESVWCLNWHPTSKSWDGMVWCNGINLCVDIYLQSGSGENTRSEYGAIPSVDQVLNFKNDLMYVGKDFMTPYDFLSIASGSNERTCCQDDVVTITGGHIDTNGRRMISFIGCEECCGYMFQHTSYFSNTTDQAYTSAYDGRGLFGQQDIYTYVTCLGGSLYKGYQSISGSRFITSEDFSIFINGNRGCCDVTIV